MTHGTSWEELNALLEEKARFERWLMQLNAKREQTPAHVFDRVRSDYASRLEAVMSQLRSRGEGLQASASGLEQQVGTLTTEESQRRDVRAEIELRALVGEYTEERANAELAACDVEINRLATERATAAAELNRIQEILNLVRPGARPSTAAPPTSRPLGAPVAHPESSAVDELAFLNSVIDRPESHAPTSVPPVSPAIAHPPVAAPDVEPEPIDDIPLVTSLEATEASKPEAAREGAVARHASGTPAFLKGMPTEQVKTLKCQECGTMNYPTEWYCERCGGELAAM